MESRVISIDFFRYWVLPIRIFSTENLRIRRNWPFSLRVCTYEISHKISLIQICRDRKHEYRSPIHSIFV